MGVRLRQKCAAPVRMLFVVLVLVLSNAVHVLEPGLIGSVAMENDERRSSTSTGLRPKYEYKYEFRSVEAST